MTELHPHPVPPRAPSLRSRRQRLLVGCAFGAMLAWNALGEKASAQAFQLNDANPSLVAGNVDFSRDVVSTPGTETITVNSPTAIINWNRAEADFLPEGNVATFQNGAGLTDFAVLNRISSLDGGAVAFNGTVRSQINGNPGGTLLFQSAGGIIVGATALFDVGNLVLTTLQVGTVDESGYGPYFNPADLRLCCANSPYNQAIITEPGSQIRAANEGSFVVLAAPRVIHGGTTYVNGSSLYFGGEGVSYTINNGLFDIVIDAGSDGNLNPIVHTGTTTGPASTGPNDPHAIYMVASPFSSGDAITMLVGGQVGFEGAAVDNGEIVISAGFDIEAGQIVDNIDRGGFSKYAESSIRITGGTFTSDVTGRATQNAIAVSDDGALSFSGDLTLVAYNDVQLGATAGGVTVAGDVSLTSLGPLEFGYGSSALAIGPLAIDLTGGEASITAANGQSITISGNASLDASATGGFDSIEDTSAGFGQGGTVRVETASGGTIQVDGNVEMLATGTGAFEDGRLPEVGGDGFGGTAVISAGGGQIGIDGGLSVDVSGTGSVSSGVNNPNGPVGASGFGGDIFIETSGSGITIAGATTLDASGNGGFLNSTDVEGIGGFAAGGSINITANGGSVSFGTVTEASVSATGEDGPNGGEGRGGTVEIAASGNGSVDLGDAFEVFVDAQGGTGVLGDGGLGQAGSVTVIPSQGQPARIAGGTFTVSADGQGGDGAGNGGQGRGGSVRFAAQSDNGVIALGNIVVTAIGEGGAGGTAGGPGDGGAGTGGSIFAGTELGYGSVGVPASASFGNLDLRADGLGGAGSRNGGAGTGGSAVVGAQTGQVSFGGASNLSARGTGGVAGSQAGGAGQGGSVGIRAFSGQTLLASAGSTVLDASGVGGRGGTGLGVGGNGTGGTASIQAFGGTLTLSGSFALSVDGTGGVSSPAIPPVGIGGNGQGGTASIEATPGGQITMGATALSSVGTGGDGILGGNGTGGRNEITGISGGRVTAGNVTAAADGIGGDGNDTQNGGVGRGGLVRLIAEADGGAIVLGDVTATARGVGGSASGSGNGGLGDGGDLFAGTELGYGGTGSAATATLGNISLDGSGIGGNANTGQAGNGLGSGADGQGGGAQIQANVGQVTIGGASSVIARGFGGSSNGAAGNGTGGIAGILARTGTTLTGNSAGQLAIDASGIGVSGDGTGGTAFVAADGGTITLVGDVAVRSNGAGGDGGSFFAGGAGAGGLARLAAFNGGSVSFANATVTSDGFGGIGGAGGVGRAGNSTQPEVQVVTGAFLVAENGTITGASATVAARGVGGDSAGVSDPLAARSDGGDGFGGTAQIVALNAAGPSAIELGSAIVDISGQGGGGATSYSGGDATAGITGVVLAETLGNSIDIGTVALFANAIGGDSGNAVDSLVGNGGNATAGFIQIGLTSGPGTGTTGGTGTFGSIQGSANAVGGAGLADGSNGGSGSGGALALLNRGGTMTAGDVTFVANGTGGAGGAAATGGAGTGGQVVARFTPRFQTADGGTATIGALSMSSTGTGGAGGTQGASFYPSAPNDSAGVVEVTGSSATFASIAINIAGDAPSEPGLAPVRLLFTDSQATVTGALSVNAPGAVELIADDATFGAGTANIVTPQTIAFATTGTGQFTGGAWTLDAGGDIGVTDATLAANQPTISAASFSATTDGDFTQDANSVIQTGTFVQVGNSIIRTGGNVLIDAAGTVDVAGALQGGTIEVRGASIDVATANGTANVITANGATVDFQAVNDLTVGNATSTGNITFTAGGSATFASVDAPGAFTGSAASLSIPDVAAGVVDLTVTAGAAQLGTIAGTTSLDIAATGDVTFDALTGGSISVASGGSIVGESASGTTVDFDAAQTASFSGTIVGNEIRVASRDIEIGDEARLGGASTQLVELEARPGQQVLIGGNAQGQGYTLTNAEAGRIRTAALEIIASPTGSAANRPPDLVVRDLTLTAAPTPTGAGVGTLGITLAAGEGGNGILSVEGALAMNNAGANNGVALTAAGGRVQIVNPQGSIRVLGSTGLPAGNVEITAANIWSASQGLIDQLVADPAFAGRDDALRTNSGATAERGYIEGGEILMRVGTSLLVQNSGTADEFAGITVVQNTLTISPTSSGQIDVFAFGRRINADGTFVINSPYFREVAFGDRGRYLASARFNNCTIATGACSGDVPPGLPVGSEVIEGPVEDTEESVPPPNPDRQEFVDVSFATESLLEEPVTSGGDSGVWDGEDGDCPPGEVCEPGSGGNP